MDLDTFVRTYTGQAVDIDGVKQDTGQCLQLVALYQQEVQNTPVFFTPNASDYWTKFQGSPLEPHYDQVSGYPLKGDIVVFSSGIGAPQGHIDICLISGNPGGFSGFDSNWGNVKNSEGYPVAHEVAHNNNFILGILRLKENIMTQDEVNAELEKRDKRMDADEANVGRLYQTVDQINKKQASDEDNVGRLYVTVDEINKRLAKLEGEK